MVMEDFNSDEEAKIEGVVNKVKALFERKGLGRFEKWRPAAILRDWITSSPDKIPSSVYETASKIFQAINHAFTRSQSSEPTST